MRRPSRSSTADPASTAAPAPTATPAFAPSARSQVPPFTVMSILGRVAELRAAGHDVVSLCAGEPGGGAPPAVDAAAAAIGQGRVEASPLLIASMSAAVASGTWQQPRLVPGEGAAAPLPDGVAGQLQELMRAVVTSGTGRAADLPGTPVHGKTGTAQYGSGDPPPTHAWFAGYRGDVGFAVLVPGGGFGAEVAAPVAARFLRQLDASATG